MWTSILKQSLTATGLAPHSAEATAAQCNEVLQASGSSKDLLQAAKALQQQLQRSRSLPQFVQAWLLLTVIAELTARQKKTHSGFKAQRSPIVPFQSAPAPDSSSSSSSSSQSANVLVGKPLVEAVKLLMDLLGEQSNPGVVVLYVNRIQELGVEVVWQTYLEAKKKYDLGTELVADRSRRRSLGGVFLQLLNLARSSAKLQAAVAAATVPNVSSTLRVYQKQAVEAVCSSGNFVVVAPTGSGKTRVAVEVARRLLQAKPGAKVLMMVPEVVLTDQQAAAFKKAGVTQVGSFSGGGGHSLALNNWRQEVSTHSVLVCTAQLVANVLNRKPRALCDVDLLVIDEVHHTTKDHPYAKVVDTWRLLKDEGQGTVPKMLGLTASPASHVTQEGAADLMRQLADKLDAQFYHIDEEDPEVEKVCATPAEKVVSVAGRRQDAAMWYDLLAVLVSVLVKLKEAVDQAVADVLDVSPEGAVDLERVYSHLAPVDQRLMDTQYITAMDRASRDTALNTVSKALKEAVGVVKSISSLHTLELKRCLHLAQELRQALHIVEDGGFEVAVSYLGARIYELQQRCQHAHDHQQQLRHQYQGMAGPAASKSAATGLQAGTSSSSQEDLSEDEEEDEAAAAGLDLLQSVTTPLGPALAAAVAGGSWGSSAPVVFSRPAKQAKRLPVPFKSPSKVLPPQLLSTGAVGAPLPWALSCLELVQDVLQRTMLGNCSCVLRSLEPIQHGRSFPRLVALEEYLAQYKGRDTFHGIVFVRQRQVVFHLASQLRACPTLGFIDEVLELIGLGTNVANKSGGALDIGGPTTLDALAAGRSPGLFKGMSGSQQQQVLQQFKKPGRKLLISTSAAEEGVDVPTCSFVVRYNAAVSGIQRAQSKGRARMKASEFVTLLQTGSSGWGETMASREELLHMKSAAEEQNMRALLRQLQEQRSNAATR